MLDAADKFTLSLFAAQFEELAPAQLVTGEPYMNLAQILARRHLGSAPAALNGETTMQSIIQIFKLDEVKKGISKKSGQPYEIHTAQAALIDENGQIDTVGVLDIPPTLRADCKVGIFAGQFAMKTNFMNGRIESVLTGLTPLPSTALNRAASAAAKSA